MRCLAILLAAVSLNAHPLTPLSADEINAAARLIRDSHRVPDSARFTIMSLDEPPKDAVLRKLDIPRRAFAVLYDDATDRTFEAVVNLTARKVERAGAIPGVEPMIGIEDSGIVDRILRADPRWRQALLARGIRDLSRVAVISWSAGHFGLPGTETGRIVRAVPHSVEGNTRNFFAHPIEGLVAHVNLTTKKVIDLLDTGRNIPIPAAEAELSSPFNLPLREPPTPLTIAQPGGPGYTIDDGEVRWQKWRFRWTLHPREGLVLYQVGYEDGVRVRPILYRASLSEMVVPYGDPSAGWFFRNSFDAGEFGLGMNASTLRSGADCPTNCRTFSAAMIESTGHATTLHNVVALYERDGGIAWKHDDETRRARDLVLGFVSTVGNYDYGFDWIFHQDGGLEMRVSLTGVMAAKAVADGAHDPFSHIVGKNIAAPHHQHFFTFRLDFDIDGASPNRVVEMNSATIAAGARNPYGGGFEMRETTLATERDAQRNLDLASGRKWIVESLGEKNALGHPTGYALLPGENAVPFALPENWVRKRAGMLSSHIWVTQYADGELYAAGNYPNQSKGGDGLPRWTKANRAIDAKDVVLWYTMGVTHNPRPEDWPVMPVHSAGFKLVPWGFFGKNPAMDLK
ncbi:MAG TPA: primary-amine oxidase [Candidatus Solibacter sp.]|nr:primary-amine oxidase [Candidatus Solibacter sp.]